TVRSEFTIVRLAEDDYYIVSAGSAQGYDGDYLVKMAESRRADLGWIEVQDVTSSWGVFALAGPRAREVLGPLVVDAARETALSNGRFPWLSAKWVDLGMVPTLAIRVAYTGELGWELHHPIEMQNHLFDRLMAVGEGAGLTPFGARAQNWLRQEKSYRAFGSDLGRDATPLEAGLDRFVDLTKDFKGKAAMEATGIRAKCVTVLIDGPADADPWGREGLFVGGEKVGRLTSGGYSVAFGKQIGIGYVRPDLALPGTELEVRVLGDLYPATVTEESPYDPKNARIRADG
ncbi:MAG: aminomethyltransferase family protein, partial [Pseudomonadota bacterium]